MPIAFSKIDGLDVTPLTPSVSISFFSRPWRRSRGQEIQPDRLAVASVI